MLRQNQDKMREDHKKQLHLAESRLREAKKNLQSQKELTTVSSSVLPAGSQGELGMQVKLQEEQLKNKQLELDSMRNQISMLQVSQENEIKQVKDAARKAMEKELEEEREGFQEQVEALQQKYKKLQHKFEAQ